jgi:hypothetical protein
MKWILLVLAFVSTLASAKGELLTYDYGNQITRSYLTVYLDGTIKHSEVQGGGKPPTPMPDEKLSPADRKTLFNSIDAVYHADLETMSGAPTTMGSSSGELVAHSMLGPRVVRKIERGKQVGDLDSITFSVAREATWIEKFVFARVANKMYP